MTKVWIQKEEMNEHFLDKLNRSLKIDGHINAIYFMSKGTEGDYVEHNKVLLQNLLIAHNTYPLYLTFTYYDDYEMIQSTLNKLGITYTLSFLEEIQTYWTANQNINYHPPCFTIQIDHSNALILALEATFGITTQNEFYAISNSQNLSFPLETIYEFRRKKEHSIPHFKTEKDTIFITIAHDGLGYYLFSNLEKHSTLEHLCANLPKGTTLEEID
ncbi:hypothetical protein CN373_01795 [Bacillus cereus]|uniref:hypothetical protein n=1 Tax=Bacillus cereus group TaxID=86661 RepID=UPI000BF9722D|nr:MULTISPECIES: hypothetical protein [Bacillus cereus group]PFA25241.1 hypothetical protein CN373_01795 [Bacillus cereus]PFO83517.1 hypothetical protein COJ77_07930 [Bacillus cereus]PGZ16677.1 hypothetical protein COE46_10520 [Bacillus cereus]